MPLLDVYGHYIPTEMLLQRVREVPYYTLSRGCTPTAVHSQLWEFHDCEAGLGLPWPREDDADNAELWPRAKLWPDVCVPERREPDRMLLLV